MIYLPLLDPTPSPTPSPAFNEDLVSPTWVGFLLTFLIALATIFLIIDMTRRVRRVRYRGEIREKLEAEASDEESPRSE